MWRKGWGSNPRSLRPSGLANHPLNRLSTFPKGTLDASFVPKLSPQRITAIQLEPAAGLEPAILSLQVRCLTIGLCWQKVCGRGFAPRRSRRLLKLEGLEPMDSNHLRFLDLYPFPDRSLRLPIPPPQFL